MGRLTLTNTNTNTEPPSLERRVEHLERLIGKFSLRVESHMNARDVIELWLRTHITVNTVSLYYESYPNGPTMAAIRNRVYSMYKDGILIRVAQGVYKKPT